VISPDALDFQKGGGLVTVVTQDDRTGALLMVAHTDREALEMTLRTGEMHYHSRSRGLWHKGAASGNTQRVVSLTADCDGDAILARVVPAGPACHTGQVSCFGAAGAHAGALGALDGTIAERVSQPDAQPQSYTRKLLQDRNLRLKKVGEEAAELVTALADGDGRRSAEEAADLVYHTVVGLRALGRSWADVEAILAQRANGPRRPEK
jgi:phosphoribosyl-ATP pyrophosphohydrolase/phosphoribosyl-AMP cyclohydrolase